MVATASSCIPVKQLPQNVTKTLPNSTLEATMRHRQPRFQTSKNSRKTAMLARTTLFCFTYLIKSTALQGRCGGRCGGANIFPTRNRLSDYESGFVNLPYPIFDFS